MCDANPKNRRKPLKMHGETEWLVGRIPPEAVDFGHRLRRSGNDPATVRQAPCAGNQPQMTLPGADQPKYPRHGILLRRMA